MAADWLWPVATLLAWCFGFTAGIAWAAQWRPTRIEVRTTLVAGEPP
jgi:hypothetical protein